jgi:isopenicillin-N epimerase
MREHWTLDPGVTFLNHGAFGACPKPVIDAASRFRALLEHEPVRFFEKVYEVELERARASVARLVGARSEDIAFVPNTTSAVNAVLGSLRLERDDVVLTTDHAYNACKNAVEYAVHRAGGRVVVARIPLPITDPGEVVERIVAHATGRVKIALVDHVTSQTGLVFPIERIVGALKERGIETLVDGAHAPGMLELRVAELGAAYYAGNFHKWLCAPKGSAMLWVRPDKQEGLHPTSISHGYTSTRGRARFLEEFDWTGSTDPSPYLSVPEAIRFLGGLLPGGLPAMYERNRALALLAQKRLSALLGVPPIAPDSMIGSLAAVPLPDSPPGASSLPATEPLHRALLDEHGIEVPVFPWPAPPKRLLRISAHVYNTESDYETLARALEIALRAEAR